MIAYFLSYNYFSYLYQKHPMRRAYSRPLFTFLLLSAYFKITLRNLRWHASLSLPVPARHFRCRHRLFHFILFIIDAIFLYSLKCILHPNYLCCLIHIQMCVEAFSLFYLIVLIVFYRENFWHNSYLLSVLE